MYLDLLLGPPGERSTTLGMRPEICPYLLSNSTEMPPERGILHMAQAMCPGE